jgi:hypothetical protein
MLLPTCRPIRQHATGRAGLYRTLLVEGKKMPLDEFREMAREPLNAPPKDASPEELERHFWRNVTLNPPLYGADVPGSLFDVQCKVGRARLGAACWAVYLRLLGVVRKQAGQRLPAAACSCMRSPQSPFPAPTLHPHHRAPTPTPTPQGWTLRRLRSLLSDTLDKHGIRMPGVNAPYLYVGSWRSVFAW